jgi:AGZA family xanthine/uracil permease-like MFS transporter
MNGNRDVSPPYLESGRVQEALTSTQEQNALTKWLQNYFDITNRGSTVDKEIRAGITTFLTMSYILIVNPQVLQLAGLPFDQVVVATALSAGLSSIATGFFANLPFGLASGVGLSIYLSYGVVQANCATLSEALTAAFLAGLLLALFTITGKHNFL